MFLVNDDFLKEEVREGFTVPEKMKRAWATMLKTLCEIDKICKRHNIKYFATYGTLLGAVRHKGFIPWDDDLDIGMLRADYMKFMEVMDEFPKPYRVKSFYSDRPFTQFHSVVCNSLDEILTYNEERTAEFFGCPFIIGIDVVPYDYVPRDPNMAKLMELMYFMGYSLSMDYEKDGVTAGFLEMLNQFNSRLGINISVDDPDFITTIRRTTDKIASRCMGEDADFLAYYPQFGYLGTANYFPKDIFDDLIEAPFENITIPIPKRANEVLINYYGSDYMTPSSIGLGHDYPFYKTQEEYFRFIGIDI